MYFTYILSIPRRSRILLYSRVFRLYSVKSVICISSQRIPTYSEIFHVFPPQAVIYIFCMYFNHISVEICILLCGLGGLGTLGLRFGNTLQICSQYTEIHYIPDHAFRIHIHTEIRSIIHAQYRSNTCQYSGGHNMMSVHVKYVAISRNMLQIHGIYPYLHA